MNTSLRYAALFAILSAINAPLAALHAQSSTLNVNASHAWMANIGWVNARPERPVAGDGVRVHDTFLCGYAWSANTGWIHFGDGSPSDVIRYANNSNFDYGVNHDGAGNLSGLAWSANTGWINFGWAAPGDTNRPRFDLSTGEFSGYAWSANCGWINLATRLLRTDTMIRLDADGDSIADTWERERAGTLPVLTSTGDADGDGISDQQEYLLDTDPLAPNAPLRITGLSKLPNLPAVEMEWECRPTRIYAVEYKTNLVDAMWTFATDVAGSAGSTTTAIMNGRLPLAYFRVSAKLPLMP